MTDVSKALAKIAAAPWRGGLLVLGVSFLSATAVSTVLGYMVLKNTEKKSVAPLRGGAPSSHFNVPEPTPSLNTAGIDEIVGRNLFNSEGDAGDNTKRDETAHPGTQQVEAVKSDLPITLVGTIYGGDPLSGIALIENTNKKTINSFMVGDALMSDAILKEVHKERIIINRNGRLEYVEVIQEKLSRSRRKKKAAPVTDTVAPIATDPPPPAFKEDGFERKDRDISMTQTYRSKLLTTDFTKVLQDAKATPNMVDGELRGFILTRIRKDSIYEKAGLQNDDIVSEVNGVPLNDTAQAIRLLQSLRNESDIDIRISRGGQPMKFNLGVH